MSGYLLFWMRYLSENFWRYSWYVFTLLQNIYKFFVCLSVCYLAYFFTERVKFWQFKGPRVAARQASCPSGLPPFTPTSHPCNGSRFEAKPKPYICKRYYVSGNHMSNKFYINVFNLNKIIFW